MNLLGGRLHTHPHKHKNSKIRLVLATLILRELTSCLLDLGIKGSPFSRVEPYSSKIRSNMFINRFWVLNNYDFIHT